MAGKLKDDEIKWILSLDASKTQQEIHKVTLESKELANTNKALAKDMRDLEAQGKKNGTEWNNLKASYDQNSKSIATNTLKIKEHEKTLGYDNMTMQQLKKTSNDLLKQLDNTSKSLHPEAYAKLEKEINAVSQAKVNLKSKTDDVSNTLNKGAASFSSFLSSAKSGDVMGMIPALGKYAAVIGLVAGALAFVGEVMMSTRATSKEFKADIEGFTNSWDYLLKSLASGDFSFRGMIEAFNAGREYKLTLGEIKKEQQALTVEEAKNFNKKQDLLELQRNVNADTKKRLEAGKEIVKMTEDEAKLKQDIADKDYKNQMKKISSLTGMSKGEYETFMENYNKKDFQALMASTKAYLKHKADLEGIMNTSGSTGGSFGGTNAVAGANASKQLDALEAKTGSSVKNMAAFFHKYNKTVGDEIDGLVEKQVTSIRVQGEAKQELQRVIRTNNKLEKELTDDEIKKQKELRKKRDDAAKAAKKILDDQLSARQRVFEDASKQLKAEEQDNNVRLKAADLFGKELVNLTKEQLAEKLRLEELYIANIQKITIDAENSRYARLKKDTGISSDQSPENSGLKGDKLKAYEIIYKEHQAILTDIVVQSEKKREDIETAVDKAVLDSLNRSNTAQLKTIEATTNAKLQAAKTEYANGKLTKKQYEDEVDRINSEGLSARLQAQQEFNDLLAGLEMAATPEYIAALQASQKAIADTQSQIDDQKIKQEENFQKEKSKVKSKYAKDSILGEYELEMEAAKKRYADGLSSEKEFEQDKWKARLGVAAKYIQKVQAVINIASDYIQAKDQAETDNLEAEKQKQLSLAGNNANARQQIEDEYAQKELDLKKKQADRDADIKVAQTIAAGALAIVQAFAQLGPIGGAVAAIVIGATTKLQIDAIKSQKAAIMASTLDSSSGSSTSSNKSGEVVVNNPGFAEGGYTGDGEKYEVAGYAHKREYVVAQEEMSNPVTAAYVRKIDNVKQQRSKRNPLPAGFADGGYTGDSNNSILQYASMNGFAEKFMEAVNKFAETKVEAEINYWEFKRSSALAEEYKGLGARK